MFANKKERILDTGPRICFFLQTAFGTSFAYLTSGVFLSGFALSIGAGDVLVSYLSVIVNICGVLILAFAAYLERFQSRKKLTVILTILSRTATLFIIVIPVAVPGQMRIGAFVFMVVLAFTLQAQTTVVLNQWMMGFMDEKTLHIAETDADPGSYSYFVCGRRFLDGFYEGRVSGICCFVRGSGSDECL